MVNMFFTELNTVQQLRPTVQQLECFSDSDATYSKTDPVSDSILLVLFILLNAEVEILLRLQLDSGRQGRTIDPRDARGTELAPATKLI